MPPCPPINIEVLELAETSAHRTILQFWIPHMRDFLCGGAHRCGGNYGNREPEETGTVAILIPAIRQQYVCHIIYLISSRQTAVC